MNTQAEHKEGSEAKSLLENTQDCDAGLELIWLQTPFSSIYMSAYICLHVCGQIHVYVEMSMVMHVETLG